MTFSGVSIRTSKVQTLKYTFVKQKLSKLTYMVEKIKDTLHNNSLYNYFFKNSLCRDKGPKQGYWAVGHARRCRKARRKTRSRADKQITGLRKRIDHNEHKTLSEKQSSSVKQNGSLESDHLSNTGQWAIMLGRISLSKR